MAFFGRRKDDAGSLDPQYLLSQAHAADPPPSSDPAVATPPSLTKQPGTAAGFRMVVEDVFQIAGRGLVATGRIESGVVIEGPATLTRTDGSARPIAVAGIEMFRKIVDRATAGDNVGLLLRGQSGTKLTRGDVDRGDVLSA